MTWNLDHAKATCRLYNLEWDQQMFEAVLPSLKAAKLTQEQFDWIIEAHIMAVATLFTPGWYTFWQRLGIAFHFLFRKTL